MSDISGSTTGAVWTTRNTAAAKMEFAERRRPTELDQQSSILTPCAISPASHER